MSEMKINNMNNKIKALLCSIGIILTCFLIVYFMYSGNPILGYILISIIVIAFGIFLYYAFLDLLK